MITLKPTDRVFVALSPVEFRGVRDPHFGLDTSRTMHPSGKPEN